MADATRTEVRDTLGLRGIRQEVWTLRTQDGVGIEGMLVWRPDRAPRTAVLSMHPTAHGVQHYELEPFAEQGFGAMRLKSRYAGDESTLIMENIVLDIAAGVEFLHERGFRHVVLYGHSGGGPIMAFYQSQAENPSVTCTPAGDPPDLTRARLTPAEALITHGAHLGRHRSMTARLDPAVIDERDPFATDPDLDMYNPRNGPPYSQEFRERYARAQVERSQRITGWVRRMLAEIEARNHPGIRDLPFIVYRTEAALSYLDLSIDPSDRPRGSNRDDDTFASNYAVKAQGRFCSLRSWLSQWSLESNADMLAHIARVSVPLLVMHGTADRSLLSNARAIHETATTRDKRIEFVPGGTHWYRGQPEILERAVATMADWLRERGL